jgi:branched-chain amino acid transport system ATP-binding protein
MTPILDVRNLTKRFGGLVAVNNLSFAVREGGVTGLIGPNGAGKTTVFNLVCGQLVPTSGAVSFKGRDVVRLAPHRRVRLGMCRSFQSTVLYAEATVIENVARGVAACSDHGFFDGIPGTAAFARRDEAMMEKAERILAMLDLTQVRDEIASSLPYGYQRALGIGIALATEPTLLMLDEPVAGMNSTETAQMAAIIRRINETGTTVLLVEHDMSFVMSLCQDIVVVNNGRKLAEGAPSDISSNPDVIAAYLGAPDDV